MSAFEASNQHRLHHLVWECNLRLAPLIDEAFADTELTLALAGTLDDIGTTPGATVADIARRGPKTQQAVSQAVARLETHGWVERRLGPGRGVGLYLTPAGELAREDGVAREQRIEVRVQELLGNEVYEALLEVLERSRSRLLASTAPAPPPAKVS